MAVSACPYEGECTTPDTLPRTQVCFANGTVATYQSDRGEQCRAGDTLTTSVYASDASLCYTAVQTTGPGCEGSSVIWFDAAGNQVAEETHDYTGTKVTILCAPGDLGSCVGECEELVPHCSFGECPSPP